MWANCLDASRPVEVKGNTQRPVARAKAKQKEPYLDPFRT